MKEASPISSILSAVPLTFGECSHFWNPWRLNGCHSGATHTVPLLEHSSKIMAAIQNETAVGYHSTKVYLPLKSLSSSGAKLYLPKPQASDTLLSHSYRPS